jgi:hypothetical protein
MARAARGPAVIAQRVALLASRSVVLLSAGKLISGIRVITVAEAWQRKTRLVRPRNRAELFSMLSNFAAAKASIGETAAARTKLEATCDELLDEATVQVVGREDLWNSYALLLSLQHEERDMWASFATMCQLSSISSTGQLMSREELDATDLQSAAERFVRLGADLPLEDLAKAFTQAIQ